MLTRMESFRPQSESTRAHRREPSLGPVDEVQFRGEAVAGIAQRMRAWNWRWIGAIAAIAMALLLLLRQPLADWLWPQTSAERLHVQAEKALAAGRLSAADGSGARELYEAALALDPDR